MGAVAEQMGSTLVWRPDAAGTPDAFTVVDWCDPGQGGVAVADSFRIVSGLVRGLEHHRERFMYGAVGNVTGDAAGGAAHDRRLAGSFWADALTTLRALVTADPAHPPLFPRVERRERGEYRLLVRPSPAVAPGDRLAGITVATADADPRRRPQVKGPDLERLAALRTQGQAIGADEAVIVDARGRVIEGAYSALLICRDGRLGVVAEPAPRIPSVTERIVRDAARTEGLPVDEVSPTVDALAGASLWVLSALHGARAVEKWVDGPDLVLDAARDAWVRRVLRDAAVPL